MIDCDLVQISPIDSAKKLERPWLKVEEVAAILDMNPQTIRTQIKQNPAKCGYPVAIHGGTIKIPRKAFLRFMGEEV